MKKRNTVIYWIATILPALGMLSTGIVQLLKVKGGSRYAPGLSWLFSNYTGQLENFGSSSPAFS